MNRVNGKPLGNIVPPRGGSGKAAPEKNEQHRDDIRAGEEIMEAKKEMTEYRNTIHLGDFMSNGLPDHCCDLIIADPPYYRVKGDFDQVWETFGDYLKDVERWAAELARLMSYNGTLVWFGSHRSIAYIQVILDRSFHLLNNCTILKKNSISY